MHVVLAKHTMGTVKQKVRHLIENVKSCKWEKNKNLTLNNGFWINIRKISIVTFNYTYK